MFEDFATNALRRRRKKLLTQLPPSDSLLRGSLIERYKRCGNANCHCQKGRGHGPKYYLSVSYPKSRPKMVYVPEAYQEKVREYLKHYADAQEILKEICAINNELLRRRETF